MARSYRSVADNLFGNSSGREGPARHHLHSDKAVAATQTLGTVGVAVTTTMGVATKANMGSIMLQAVPIFAIIQGALSIANGVFSFIDSTHLGSIHFKKASARNRTRGIFEFVSGAYLAEGGIEAAAKTFFDTDITSGLGGLYFRLAVYSFSQFLLALGDLYSYYQLSSNDKAHEVANAFWYKTMGMLVGAALLTVGWGLLAATDGVVDIKSCLSFVGATAAFASTYVPRGWFSFHKEESNLQATSKGEGDVLAVSAENNIGTSEQQHRSGKGPVRTDYRRVENNFN